MQKKETEDDKKSARKILTLRNIKTVIRTSIGVAICFSPVFIASAAIAILS